ncbi:MAG: cyclic peptide export ABC transporter [Pseudomonadota bacterium]
MEIFRTLFRTHARIISLAFVLNIGGAIAGLSLIAFLNSAIADLDRLNVASLALMAGLALTLFASAATSQSLFAMIGQRVVHDLRLRMSERLLAADLERLHQIGAPRILAVLTKDIATIAQAFNGLPFVIFGAAVVTAAGIYMALLYPPYFIILSIMTLLAVGIAMQLMARSRKHRAEAREADDKIYEAFEAVISGQAELKLNRHREQDFLAHQMAPAIEEARIAETTADRFSVTTTAWINSVVLLVIVSVFSMYVFFDLGGAEALSGYALAILFVRSPIAGLMGQIPHLIRGQVAMTKVESLGLPSHGPDTSDLPALRDDWGSLELNSISFQYPAEDGEQGFAFGPVDLSIKQGELIFIVGGNGSGKSTLARLLLGLYTPQNGSVSFAGEPVSAGNAVWFRQHFAAVLTDFYLFDRVLGPDGKLPPLSLTDSLLQHFKLTEKVGIEDSAWTTTDLSQGQRKRLALIAACLADRPILLLDEWAADQDPEFRKIFYTEFLPNLKKNGKTVIAITHDDHYFHVADRILKLDEGHIDVMPATAPAHG